MRTPLLLFLLVFLLLMAPNPAPAAGYAPELPPMECRDAPAIVRVAPGAATIPRFGKFELTIDLAASYDNPFDPEQVDLTAEFTGPSGGRTVVPGFFYQPYRNRNANDDARRPLLDPAGAPRWKIRFTPVETGAHRYVVRLHNRFGATRADLESAPGTFTTTASDAPGFVRVSKTDPHQFQFDDGQPFLAIGQNLQNDWPTRRHSRLLAGGDANCARVWTFCHYTWLEWTFKGDLKWAGPGDWMRSYAGAGRYNQRVAWIADHCLEQWARDGLVVMLCLGNATGGGELSREKEPSYGSWAGHPYNVDNGGFLDDPARFWTDPRARALYKQRLRYIVARWGYSPHVWAWEFWNELGEARPEITAWHAEMGAYLRALDPNRHLVTTSTWQGNADKFAAVWDLAEIDFTQIHHYGPLPPLEPRIAECLRRWTKPCIVGEGGGPPAPGWDDKDAKRQSLADPDSVEFHNSLWAPPAGSAGATLPWWWRDRIEPLDLFFHYRALARFACAIPWHSGPLRSLQIESVTPAPGAPPRTRFAPVLIAPFGADWGSKPTHNRFRVLPDGTLTEPDRFRGELYGNAPARKQWRNPPTFETNYPEPGRFIARVARSTYGSLEIRLDGKPVVTGKPEQNEASIDVPAGRHDITLDNAGADLVRLRHILLTHYRDATRHPDIEIVGRQTDDLALLWICNRLDQWPYREAGIEPAAAGPATAAIAGLKDGAYAVEWWNTRTGAIDRIEPAQVRAGVLELPIPALEHDAACKIRRRP